MSYRKLRKELLPYMMEILKETDQTFVYDEENEKIDLPVSSKKFHLLVDRILCMEEQDKHEHGTPYVSADMFHAGQAPQGNFVVLPRDTKRFLHEAAGMTEEEIAQVLT